jgi:hypothetical protein
LSNMRSSPEGCEPSPPNRCQVHNVRSSFMKYMQTFTMKPEIKGRDEGFARFKRTGGEPPKGAKLLGRWTAAEFSGGYALLESDDAKPWRNSRFVRQPDGFEDHPCVRRCGIQRGAATHRKVAASLRESTRHWQRNSKSDRTQLTAVNFPNAFEVHVKECCSTPLS